MGAFLKRFPAKVALALAIVAGAFALFLIVFALICTLSKPNVGALPSDAQAQQSAAADVGKNRRPLEDAYYSYPEWYIV